MAFHGVHTAQNGATEEKTRTTCYPDLPDKFMAIRQQMIGLKRNSKQY